MKNKFECGNMSKVIYKDNIVYRDLKPQSKTIHKLLKHLEEKNINFVPKFLGIYEETQEMLSYVNGNTIEDYPNVCDLDKKIEIVREAAVLLKKFHDATEDYVADSGDIWFLRYNGNLKKEVICHNDFAPYNITFEENKPVGIIDFDTACPAPRIWDVAYAAYRFVPLSYRIYDKNKNEYRIYDKNIDKDERKILLYEFLNEYGMSDIREVIKTVLLRLQSLVDLFDEECQKGNMAFVKMKREGHQELYKKEIKFIEENMNDWF